MGGVGESFFLKLSLLHLSKKICFLIDQTQIIFSCEQIVSLKKTEEKFKQQIHGNSYFF
jgi:flavorubredoxin